MVELGKDLEDRTSELNLTYKQKSDTELSNMGLQSFECCSGNKCPRSSYRI